MIGCVGGVRAFPFQKWIYCSNQFNKMYEICDMLDVASEPAPPLYVANICEISETEKREREIRYLKIASNNPRKCLKLEKWLLIATNNPRKCLNSKSCY